MPSLTKTKEVIDFKNNFIKSDVDLKQGEERTIINTALNGNIMNFNLMDLFSQFMQNGALNSESTNQQNSIPNNSVYLNTDYPEPIFPLQAQCSGMFCRYLEE